MSQTNVTRPLTRNDDIYSRLVFAEGAYKRHSVGLYSIACLALTQFRQCRTPDCRINAFPAGAIHISCYGERLVNKLPPAFGLEQSAA